MKLQLTWIWTVQNHETAERRLDPSHSRINRGVKTLGPSAAAQLTLQLHRGLLQSIRIYFQIHRKKYIKKFILLKKNTD